VSRGRKRPVVEMSLWKGNISRWDITRFRRGEQEMMEAGKVALKEQGKMESASGGGKFTIRLD
jgi:hypothetical protein